MAASALAVVGLALPAAAVTLSPCRARRGGCDDFKVEVFEVCVLLSQAAVAAVALACVFWKMVYGLRKFLFVDPDLGMRIWFQKEYVAKIKVDAVIFHASQQPGLTQWRKQAWLEQQHGHGDPVKENCEWGGKSNGVIVQFGGWTIGLFLQQNSCF